MACPAPDVAIGGICGSKSQCDRHAALLWIFAALLNRNDLGLGSHTRAKLLWKIFPMTVNQLMAHYNYVHVGT